VAAVEVVEPAVMVTGAAVPAAEIAAPVVKPAAASIDINLLDNLEQLPQTKPAGVFI
jgi:hypothetical protein